MKYVFLYQTTCLINNKIYIGVHSTNNLDDGYIGNGITKQSKAFKKNAFHLAVRKYGYENFQREILEYFETKKEAFEKEKKIVNESFCKSKNNYNVAIGGVGNTRAGLSEEKKDNWKRKLSVANKGKKLSQETKDKLSKANKGRAVSKESRIKIGRAKKGKNHHFYGKSLSQEHRNKISEGNKGKKFSLEIRIKSSESKKGDKNPMYGKLGKDHHLFGTKYKPEKIKQMKSAASKYMYDTPMGIFEGVTDAAKANGCAAPTVIRRCNNKSLKFWNRYEK